MTISNFCSDALGTFKSSENRNAEDLKGKRMGLDLSIFMNKKTSARSLTFSTAAGLVFEWAPLLGGRAGERKMVELMSMLGAACAPIEEWEDVAKNSGTRVEDNNMHIQLKNKYSEGDEDTTFWTALSDVMTAKEFDETVYRLEEGDILSVNGLVDDGVFITGQPTGLAREGLNEKNADTDEENEAEEEMSNDYEVKSGRHVFGIEHAFHCFEMMAKAKKVENTQRESGSMKRPPILTPDILNEQNKKALRNDPNISGKRKLLQLKRLQKLHVLYEKAKLKKCLLSFIIYL